MYAFAYHNFTENYLNAEGYSDQFMTTQMLKDELAKLIVDSKADVVKLLRENGFNSSLNDNNAVVAVMLFASLPKNENLKKQISDLIVNKAIDEVNAKLIIKNFAGVQTKKNIDNKYPIEGINWQGLSKNEDVKGAVSGLVQLGLTRITEGKGGVGTNQPTAAEELESLQQRIKLAEAKKKKFPMWAKVLIGVTVVGGAAVALYFILRKKGEAAAAAE